MLYFFPIYSHMYDQPQNSEPEDNLNINNNNKLIIVKNSRADWSNSQDFFKKNTWAHIKTIYGETICKDSP